MGVTVADSKFMMKIGLPTAATATQTSAGTLVYADTDRDYDVAVQSLANDSVRILVTLADRSAPSEYRFPLTLPIGSRLSATVDGGFYVMTANDAEVLGKIEAPWATDAAGTAVPTSYRLQGDTIVQTVRTDDKTIFPVVADPTFGWDWTPPGPAAYFNKNETRTTADSDYWELVSILAGYLAASPAMAAAAAVQIWHIKGWAKRAKDEGKCLKLVLYLGIIEGETYTGGNCK
ncbi:hypothetical protein [Phytohabitans aurantiacus]|uniref:Uncharacterized protein n=1 Tax=Phytohabitans aurantiacus TaxID=3016789 RepID=A0ABQ5QPG4_9ACTN|nr:hypothetical protein [Phytohabitans aurantiacus]GLH95205.1 hypothetical protein Pa4123_04770 [Phytohabitans aurantiacus]